MLGPPAPDPFDPGTLRTGSDLRRRGVEPSRAPGWHHVGHGAWLASTAWDGLLAVQQHAAVVHAADLRGSGSAARTYALTSAAALWGLPRIGSWPDTVQILVADASVRGTRVVRPHLGPAAETVVLHGLRVTSAARTVVDLARTDSLDSALAAADHALRHGLCTPEQLADEVAAVPASSRGRRVAALVRDLADPLSMSPGESLSRLQMYRLNVPRPMLQGKREDSDGLIGYVDFDWGDAVGEFDGKLKYKIPEGADPATAGEIVWREKKREDRIRRQASVGRWVWSDALDVERLRPILAAAGIRSAPRNTWFDLGTDHAG